MLTMKSSNNTENCEYIPLSEMTEDVLVKLAQCRTRLFTLSMIFSLPNRTQLLLYVSKHGASSFNTPLAAVSVDWIH